MRSSACLRAVSLWAFLVLSGCFVRPVCPPDSGGLSGALLTGTLPDKTLHARLRAETRRGLFVFSADGDLFFVPPDTLRLQVRSEWGEALFDLKAAGADVRIVPEKMAFVGDWLNRFGRPEALYRILAGQPGLFTLLDSAAHRMECGKKGAAAADARFRVFLDKGAGRMVRVESRDGSFFMALEKPVARGPDQGLPGRIRFGVPGNDYFDLVFLSRVYGRSFTGVSLLK